MVIRYKDIWWKNRDSFLKWRNLPAWLKNAADDAKNGRIYKGVTCFEAHGVIGDTVEFIKVEKEVGTAIQEGHNGKVCKVTQDFVFGNVFV